MAQAREEKQMDPIVLQEVKWIGLADGRTVRDDKEGGLSTGQMEAAFTKMGLA